MHDLRIFPDKKSLSRAIAEEFAQRVREHAVMGKTFTVALAGGATPRTLYEVLATEYRQEVPWKSVHLFWSDERYVPLDHPDSNYRLVREALLDLIEIPPMNIHAAPTGFDRPDEAARVYERVLRDPTGSGRLDWILLGLGEDGHLASLFPRSPALGETRRWVVAVRSSPKPPPVRLTFTLPLMNRAAQIHFLVSGCEKAEALRSAVEGPYDRSRFPAQGVRPINGSVTWWADQQAAGGLKKSAASKRQSLGERLD